MNNAFLQISGKNGDDTVIDFSGECKLEQSGDNYFITYFENENSGMTGTETCIALSKELITLTRTGSFSTSLVFEKDREYCTEIQTPFGFMSVSVFCEQYNYFKKGQELFANLQYHINHSGTAIKNTIDLVCKIY